MIVVVSDTSPIRALAGLGLIHILPKLFEQILIPPAVVHELEHPPARSSPVKVSEFYFLRVQSPSDAQRVRHLRNSLDWGESEAIALALEAHADWLLIDEREGARLAKQLGLRSLGVLGLLVHAKREGLVPAIDPLIIRLTSELSFFVSTDARQAALRLAGEPA